MREREEKRVVDADANILFERIRRNRDTLSYKESVNILNDLSYLVVPVDQNKAEFKQLIAKIKFGLQTDKNLVSMHNFELVEALCKLQVDSLNELMRQLVRDKHLSRGTKDIAIQLLYFSSLFKQHQQVGDGEIIY